MSLSLYARLHRRFGPRADELTRRDMLRATALLGAGLLLSNRLAFGQQAKKGKRVVVVGAGFAGLAAAHELLAAGYDVSVVEARKRVGGRVLSLSDFIDGRTVEGGAELVGDNHLTWLAYAKKFGLEFTPMTDDESLTYPIYLDGKLLAAEEASKLYEDLDEIVTDMAKESLPINADEPWKSPKAEELDKKSLADWIAACSGSELTKKAFGVEWTANSGVVPSKQSYLGFLATVRGGMLKDDDGKITDEHLLDYFKLTETCRCTGGNQQLAERLTQAIGRDHIQVGLAVTEIKVTDKMCVLRCADGRTYECDDVILAAPPSTWGKIKFDPDLPEPLKQQQMGVNVKYLAEVKKRFWLDDKRSQYALSDLDVNMTWDATDGQSGDEKICFTSFSGGPSAEAARGRQGAARDDAYKAALEKLYPGFGANFLKSRFMDWPGDPWTAASYSFPAPGQVTKIGPLLRKGIGNRLHFAGEHTCYQFAGYMEGALYSGVSLAERLAQRDGIAKPEAKEPTTKPAPAMK